MEDVLQWILTFKNKNNETLKKLPLIGCIGTFHLFGYYLEYITKKVPTHWNYKEKLINGR
jgi:hypothetical protein